MCAHIRFVTFLFLVLSVSQLGIHYRIAQYKVIQDCLGLHAVESRFFVALIKTQKSTFQSKKTLE